MYWVLFYLQNLFRTNKNKFDFYSLNDLPKAFGVYREQLANPSIWFFFKEVSLCDVVFNNNPFSIAPWLQNRIGT